MTDFHDAPCRRSDICFPRRSFLKAGALAASSLPLANLLASDALPKSEALVALHSGRKLKATIAPAPSGKVMLLVDGKPQPLYWASLAGIGGDDYRSAGMNTIFYELHHPGHGVSLENAMEGWDRQLADIKRQGLLVILYVHNTIHAHIAKQPFAFDAPWREYVQKIVKRYRGMTNLIGWNYSDEPGDPITYPDALFQEYLRREYPDIAALNRTWQTDYADFSKITLEYANDGHGLPKDSMVQSQFPYGIGPKAFDSARFKIHRVAEGHRRFAEAVREVDPTTPLWSGAHNFAWTAPTVPSHWGIYFDFYPEYSGTDFQTHHVWTVDIGRAGNTRPSLAMLLPEHPTKHDWHLDPGVLRGWMVESAIHGSAGVTFWPWSLLGVDNRPGDRSTNKQRIEMCRATIETLHKSGIHAMCPRNTIATIYQPYAEGWSAATQVYGVMHKPDEEPFILMQQLRFGTRYGQVDYLGDEQLCQIDLNAYGVILAQFAVDLRAESLAKLTEYVQRGGVLFADIGFDCMRGGKTITSMSEDAKRLFGIKSLRDTAASGRFVATGQCADLLGGLKKGEDGTFELFRYALDVEPTTAVAALQGPGGQGLYVNRVGEGYAIFCSTLGWSRGVVKDPVLRKIHNALFARRSQIERLGEDDWSKIEADWSFAPGYELANFTGGYAIQNRTDQPMAFSLRAAERERRHKVGPHSVILVKGNRVIPLGPGVQNR